MLGDDFYRKIYEKAPPSKPSQSSSPELSEGFKREMLGAEFYDHIHKKQTVTKSSRKISEDLKREMLGEEFYNRIYGKTHNPKRSGTKAIHKQEMLSKSQENPLQEGQDHELNNSLKPSSRGSRR